MGELIVIVRVMYPLIIRKKKLDKYDHKINVENMH